MKLKISSIILLLAVSALISADFSFWAGPTRDGRYPDQNLLKAWPEEGPSLLWSADSIGTGYSAAAAADGRVFVTGMIDNTGYLFAFDDLGQELWKTQYGTEWTRGFPGTRSTPVVSEGFVFLESAMGSVFCFNAEDGAMVWKRDLFGSFGGDNIQYGLAESVLVHRTAVICTPGGVEQNIVALDRYTGQTLWSSKAMGEPQAYCSPTIIKRDGHEMILTITGGSLLALEFETGKMLWHHTFISRNGYFPNTPIYLDGYVYGVSGYRSGGIMLQLSPDNRQVAEIWRNASLDNQMGGVVVVDGYIYGAGHQNDPSWQCLDWRTGEVQYATDIIQQGGVIYADGMLYCYSEDGQVSMVPANPKEFELAGSFNVEQGSGEHFAHMIIDDGRLFVRHGSSLLVYDIKG